MTAYSDTEAAIRAINEVGLDYYLQKPWDPPDQNLYPNLDDMLGDWRAGYRPPFSGLRVVGDRWWGGREGERPVAPSRKPGAVAATASTKGDRLCLIS